MPADEHQLKPFFASCGVSVLSILRKFQNDPIVHEVLLHQGFQRFLAPKLPPLEGLLLNEFLTICFTVIWISRTKFLPRDPYGRKKLGANQPSN
jgi:hypothetical protein